jgi:hypothetical protein
VDVSCGPDASCNVDGNNVQGADISLTCESGSDCCVMCNSRDNATDCTVICAPGATCEVHCAGGPGTCTCSGPGACDELNDNDSCL